MLLSKKNKSNISNGSALVHLFSTSNFVILLEGTQKYFWPLDFLIISCDSTLD